MNCQIFETIVCELARKQTIRADVREQALVHAGECGDCMLRLQNEKTLTLRLRALALEMDQSQVSPRSAAQLLAVFRPEGFHGSKDVAGQRWRYWAAAAAVAILSVAAFAVFQSSKSTDSTTDFKASRSAATDVPLNQADPGGKPIELTQSEDHLALKNRRRGNNVWPKRISAKRNETPSSTANATTINLGRREIATDFFPLGHTSALGLQDGGQIVRIEMPRSALASFGLPINMERYNERLTADVWLGTDGVPRAIRFVETLQGITSGSGPGVKEGNYERNR
jgi:hypothetical protein